MQEKIFGRQGSSKDSILPELPEVGGIKMNGTVKFFNNSKGFGFIAGEDGKEYFVHQTGLNDGVSLRENDKVTFEVAQGERGPKAVKVSKE